MKLSGTSIAAPAVAGTVALMLQANPGLTPPLIKAILQYSAQPIAGANLLQQGAGLLNVDGAVQLAKVLRTDIKTAVEAGTHRRRRQPAGQRQDDAGEDFDAQRPDLQLEPHRLCRRQPDRQRRRTVHQVPADLGPPPGVGRQAWRAATR